MILPERLRKGDRIGICAPAGPVKQETFESGIRFIESLGLRVKLTPHIYAKQGYLAGTDAERLADFHALLKDETVKGIIFARGGYGCARFVSEIDFELVSKHPKIMWGFSDITYLHTAIFQKTGVVTFHGPMIMTAGREGFDTISQDGFQQLFSPETQHYDETLSPLKTIEPGTATAPLIGGNLSLLVRTLGTPFEVNFKNKIVFIEDINEELYKIDAAFTQLKLAGKWEDVAGIVVGDFNHAGLSLKKSDGEWQKDLNLLLEGFFKGTNIPVLSGFKIGHCFPHFAVAHGSYATLDTYEKTLTIAPGVS